ncbi:AbiH family protein [Leptobacterium sp. I13]|uniref:AbiH family protein n=1 Tax=Leptobacterium meishanense TaxID=3128904 RepID=UPI0030EF2FAE
MNRLILIGNGFDLAHGLETRYEDFILDYYRTVIENFCNKKIPYSDPFFKLNHNETPNIYRMSLPRSMNDINDIKKFIKNSKEYNIRIDLLSRLMRLGLYNIMMNNWVDIEREYYEFLIKFLKNNNRSATPTPIPPDIVQLNSDLEYVKEKLEKYLTRLNIQNMKHIEDNSDAFNKVFFEEIKTDEIVVQKTLMEDKEPETIYFLNFNYTSTINHYQKWAGGRTLHVNHIHGELNNEKNPVIFGYGDEWDKEYLEFENLKNDDLFKHVNEHIKSYRYSQTSNYHEMVRFVESGELQIYIMGHSCGLSDRTMLRFIFEHENCKSIKIFFHLKDDGTDDYTDKVYNISRHFRDKGLMRRKVVPKDKSKPMPKL